MKIHFLDQLPNKIKAGQERCSNYCLDERRRKGKKKKFFLLGKLEKKERKIEGEEIMKREVVGRDHIRFEETEKSCLT